MTTRRLNKSVNALRKFLVDHQVPSADQIARLLLTEGSTHYSTDLDTDNFTINIASNGPFSSVIGPSLSTTQLRNTLITAGLLTRVNSSTGPEQWKLGLTDKLKKYRARYEYEVKGIEDPAVALKKEVERLERKAAKDNNKLKEEIELLKQGQKESQEQFMAIWAAIQHIEKNDAPVTEEKIARHLRVL